MIILLHLYSQIQQFKKPSNSWDLDHKKLLAVFQFEELTEQERSASIPIMNPLGSNNKHLSKIPEPLLAKTPDHHHQLPIPWNITAIRFVNLSRPKKRKPSNSEPHRTRISVHQIWITLCHMRLCFHSKKINVKNVTPKLTQYSWAEKYWEVQLPTSTKTCVPDHHGGQWHPVSFQAQHNLFK